jgi:acetyltransferase-like isoleucine patch superfamily enzyme
MGENSVLGAGGVLTKNLEAHKTAIGVPAKIKEK